MYVHALFNENVTLPLRTDDPNETGTKHKFCSAGDCIIHSVVCLTTLFLSELSTECFLCQFPASSLLLKAIQ